MTSTTTPLPYKPPAISNNALYGVLGLAIIGVSFAAVFMRLALNEGVPASFVIAGRLGLSVILLTPFVWRRYRGELARMTRKEVIYAVIAGIWMGLHFLFVVNAIKHTTILTSQVLVNTIPLWTALLEMTLLKTRLHWLIWVGLLLTLVGSVIIAVFGGSFSLEGQNLLGSILALFSAIAAGIYLVIGRRIRQSLSNVPAIWLMFGVGALVAVVAVLVEGAPILGHPPVGYLWIVMATLVAQFIGHSSYTYVLGYLPATLVSLSGQSATVIAALLAFLIFAEVPGAAQIFASVILVLGVVLAIIGQNQQRSISPPAATQ